MCASSRVIFLLTFIILSSYYFVSANNQTADGETPVSMPRHHSLVRSQKKQYHFGKWSAWSRCIDCLQKRMKKCTNCGDRRIYEERACTRTRCRRRSRQQDRFRIIHVNKNSSYLTRQAPARIWSKWTSWSPCSQSCRTRRARICRKPGRCRKKRQEQAAYCYHEKSHCELYVLNLMDNQQYESKYVYDNDRQARRKLPQSRRKAIPKKCGRPFKTSRMFKIIGGIESRKHKWPWHVAVINKYSEVFCGGTLIGPQWVLTASHCIRSYLRVRLNEHDLRAVDGRELELVVRRMFQHPRFNHKTVDNDIALLQLPQTVNTPAACLPTKHPKPLEMCNVMGWGKISTSDTYGTVTLHEAKLPVVDQEVCKRSYRHFLITPNMLCAGWPSGKSDTCAGDSGGGLMCPFKAAPASTLVAYTIQGITSFGDGCGLKHKYGIYTAVFNYLKWITYIMDHYS